MAETLPEPASRKEQYLAKIAGDETVVLPEPASRKEAYLATIAGMTGVILPEKPANREEEYLAAIAENGGGGGGGGGGNDWGTVTYLDNDNNEVTGTLQSFEEFESLSNPGSLDTHDVVVDGQRTSIDKVTAVNLGKSAKYVGNYFLYNATALTSFSADHLEYIGDYFLSRTSGSAVSFDISLPELKVLGNNFLYGSPNNSFNNAINMPKVEYLSNGFMQSKTAFNKPLIMPLLREIPANFLNGCSVFNSEVDFSSVEEIGNFVFANCAQFNQPLILPEVRIIGESFLRYCYAFDSAIEFPKLEKLIPSSWMADCSSFNQDITFPETLVSTANYNGPSILNGANSYTSTITFNCPTSILRESTSNGTRNMIRGGSASSAIASTGFYLSGPYASDWKAILPNRVNNNLVRYVRGII